MSEKQQSRAAVYAVLDLLCENFPACFKRYEQRRRPLKVGIHADLLAVLDGAITPKELGLALRIYVSNKWYRSRLIAGVERIDLDGKPCGVVTPEHAAPVPTRSPRKPVPVPPAPAVITEVQAPAAPDGRLTLAGLRAAAQRRREGTAA